MTIDSAFAGAFAALPAQRGVLPTTRVLPAGTAPTDTRPLPVLTPARDTDLPDAPRWQVYAAVAAGLLGGVLMVAGIVLPW
jgi:hypothetical protein